MNQSGYAFPAPAALPRFSDRDWSALRVLQGKHLKENERHEVKEIARALLQRLMDRELQVEHWFEKI